MPSVPYTFSPGTVISSAQVNANFAVLASCLDASGGSVSGSITPDTANTYDLGSSTLYWRAIYTNALKLSDTDHTNFLSMVLGSNLTANRTLTIVTGDSDRTLTLTGDATLGGVGYYAGGTDVALADGGTGASLTDPGADRIMFWDDSAGTVAWLTAGTGLSISGTTITTTSGGTIGGSTGATDNQLIRADGTGGSTIQSSAVTVDDSGNMSNVGQLTYGTCNVMSLVTKSIDTVYLAGSDGFVEGVVDCTAGGSSTGSVTILADASDPPTTFRGSNTAVDGQAASAMAAVIKGHHFKVVSNTQGGTPSYSVRWIPLGTAG